MIETYEKPEIEISVFDVDDIVTESIIPTITTTQGGGNFGDFD